MRLLLNVTLNDKKLNVIQMYKNNFCDYQGMARNCVFSRVPFSRIKFIHYKSSSSEIRYKISPDPSDMNTCNIGPSYRERSCSGIGNFQISSPKPLPCPRFNTDKIKDIMSLARFMGSEDVAYYEALFIQHRKDTVRFFQYCS